MGLPAQLTLVCRGYNEQLISRQRDARKFITPWLTAKAAGREVGTADTLRYLREQDAGLLPDQQERALKRLLSRGWQVCFEAHLVLKGILVAWLEDMSAVGQACTAGCTLQEAAASGLAVDGALHCSEA